MRILNETEPKEVMRYFEDICSIPHGSGNTGMIADYCERFAAEHSLECIRDEHNNVIIKKPASDPELAGETVIIQGHLDMVCAKEPGVDIDLESEGLRLKTDGEYIWADGTTLGGDDGIAVAMALAVLASDGIRHPNLECVFTTDEEVGMLGASALDTENISGRMLLNIDSEEEGIFTVSCAGGAVLTAALPITRYGSDKNESGKRYTVRIEGLTGGHSGTEIDKGRENACVMLGRLLADLDARAEYALVSVNGGEKDNAIPRCAEAEIETRDLSGFEAAVAEIAGEYKLRYGCAEPKLAIELRGCDACEMPMYSACKAAVIRLLTGLPNGVKRMSPDIRDLVETSDNIGILETNGESVTVTVSVRSSDEDEKAALLGEIAMAVTSAGGEYSVSGEYPAWEYKKESRLRDAAAEVYVKQYGSQPVISVIHAGLECGIFCGKLPELDCISFGPNILDIHTPQERLDIGSTARVYDFLKELLGRLG